MGVSRIASVDVVGRGVLGPSSTTVVAGGAIACATSHNNSCALSLGIRVCLQVVFYQGVWGRKSAVLLFTRSFVDDVVDVVVELVAGAL